MIQAVKPWTPAVAWAGVLFLLSTRSSLGGLAWMPAWGDELGHGVLFAVLGAALAFGSRHSAWPRGLSGHVAVVLVGVLYGLSDEWHQSFVPGRDPSATDLLADTLGVALGYSLSMLLPHAHDPAGASPAGPDA